MPDPAETPVTVPSAEQAKPVPPETVMDLLESAWELLSSVGGEFPEKNPRWAFLRSGWRDRYQALVAGYATARALIAAEPRYAITITSASPLAITGARVQE